MSRYVLKRLIASLITLWVIVTLTFILMHSIPGGPFSYEKELPKAIIENLNKRYHLDWPLWKQYLDYLVHLIQWDLGPSFKYESMTVNDIINKGFPVSAALGGISLGFALVLGITAGVISALKQYQWQDSLVMLMATLGFSVPSFILASLFIYIFSYKLHWLPAAMWGKPEQVIMPALALSALPTAFIARMVRTTMLEVLSQDYIRTAWAKGLSGRVVILRHALKNALLPVLSYLGPLTAAILTGSFVVEKIFGIPGMGRQFVTSIYNRDYTTIMGVTIFYSIILILANFLVDIMYAYLDPRIKVTGEKE
ncbi:MAG: ABC transporter permease [Peptococcaceae bacterium]|nr:ABC transporter permease [Peptococcaceae bacterium]